MKNILVLDDDKAFIETVKATLDESRYKMTSAGNGKEGLKCLETLKPDLILLDIKMPEMDGIEFLKAMNEKYGEGKIPVLITSNSESLDKISEGVSLGIIGYIVKSNESLQSIVAAIEKSVH